MDGCTCVGMYVCMYVCGSFRTLGGTLFGVLTIRILLFRVLYWGPLFSETPMYVCMYVHISYVNKPPAGHRGRLFVGGFGPGNRQRGPGLVKDFNSS